MPKRFCSAYPCSVLVTRPARYCEKHTRSKGSPNTGAHSSVSESGRGGGSGGNNSGGGNAGGGSIGGADTARHPAMDQDKKITVPFYGTARWQEFRRWYRKSHPLCEICLKHGQYVVGHLVDHIIELSDGGAELDPENCQTLCNTCHGKKTAAEREKRGGQKPLPKIYTY